MKENSLNFIHFSFGILSIALSITIFGLDMSIMVKTSYSGSIAYWSTNTFISYTSFHSAINTLGIFHMIGIASSIFIGLYQKKLTLLISSVVLILMIIPREGVAYKFFICFNYTYYQIVQARACLTLVSVIVLIVIHIGIMFSKDDETQRLYKIGKILLFIASFLALVGIGVLNILTLINLKTDFNKDINPKTIKIGYFTEYEKAQIEQYNLIKDSNYTNRIIGSLYDIIESEDKKVAYMTCSESSCTHYYLRTLNVEITCNSETENFYSDCMTAQKIKIQMKYLDNDDYPIYNCGFVDKNETCKRGCPGLMNHKLFLVQEFNNRVELGWNGYCNCEVKAPKVELAEDLELNICDNKGSYLKTNYLILNFLNVSTNTPFQILQIQNVLTKYIKFREHEPIINVVSPSVPTNTLKLDNELLKYAGFVFLLINIKKFYLYVKIIWRALII
ncbi:unnamed protein product [Brachionus calyciflorus]|uniref:Uncharacterized protein n=1 Tax=Brachionus calyciflorus TaxID=104777 RepID=A0A813PDJ5_9BILA|nr:unnamed protein product [Brachionus calyciflorus]